MAPSVNNMGRRFWNQPSRSSREGRRAAPPNRACVPKYRFQVKDDAGRLRTGSLEAETLEAAREQIQSRGFEIVALQALAGTVAAASAEVASFELEEQPTRHRLDGVMLAIGVLGLLGCVHALLPRSEATSVQPHVPCSVQVQGTVQMAGVSDFSDVQLVLDFPEVPVQWTKPWKSVTTKRAGEFRLVAEFEAPSAPRVCRLVVRKPGYREASQELALPASAARFERSVVLQRL